MQRDADGDHAAAAGEVGRPRRRRAGRGGPVEVGHVVQSRSAARQTGTDGPFRDVVTVRRRRRPSLPAGPGRRRTSAPMAVGDSRWTFLLQPTGRIEVLAASTRTGDDTYVFDTDAGFGDALAARLNRFKIRVEADSTSARDVDPDGLVGSWTGRSPTRPRTRIEAGWPAMGAEIVPGETIPAETGVCRVAVDFKKGCYPGQELVERMDSRGADAAAPAARARRRPRGRRRAIRSSTSTAPRSACYTTVAAGTGARLRQSRRRPRRRKCERRVRTSVRVAHVRPERLLRRALVDGRGSPRAVDRGSDAGIGADAGELRGGVHQRRHLVARRAGVDRLAEPRRRRGGIAERAAARATPRPPAPAG